MNLGQVQTRPSPPVSILYLSFVSPWGSPSKELPSPGFCALCNYEVVLKREVQWVPGTSLHFRSTDTITRN